MEKPPTPYTRGNVTPLQVAQACNRALDESLCVDQLPSWAQHALKSGDVKARSAALWRLHLLELEEYRQEAVYSGYAEYLPRDFAEVLAYPLGDRPAGQARRELLDALWAYYKLRRDAEAPVPTQVASNRSKGKRRRHKAPASK
jgi:hypothetical protein